MEKAPLLKTSHPRAYRLPGASPECFLVERVTVRVPATRISFSSPAHLFLSPLAGEPTRMAVSLV